MLPKDKKLYVLIPAAAVAGLIALHLMVPDAPHSLGPAENSESFATDCTVLGASASKLGLNEDDILIDPRHPTVFAMYHVDGACNLDPRQLLKDRELRIGLENSGKRLVFITEDAQTLSYLYSKILDAGHSDERWLLLDAGLLFFDLLSTKRPDFIQLDGLSRSYEGDLQVLPNTKFHESLAVDQKYQIDRPSRLVQALTNRPGAIPSITYPSSILGSHKSWRERRPSFLRSETALYTTVVMIDDSQPSDSFTATRKAHYPKYTLEFSLVNTGGLITSMEDLDALANRRIERVLFVLSVPTFISTAEALAVEQLNRGGEVLGYIVDRLYISDTGTIADKTHPSEGFTTTWIVFFILVIGHGVLFIVLKRLLNTTLKKMDASPVRNLVARLVLALIPVIFGWVSVLVLLRWPQINMWGVFLSDVGRFGWGVLSLLSLAANLLVLGWFFILSRGPKKGWYWPITGIFFLISLLLPVLVGLTVMEATCFTLIVVTPYLVAGVCALVRLARSRR